MGTPSVVMVGEHREHTLQMASVQNQKPIQAFGSSGHLPRVLRNPFGVGMSRAPRKMGATAADLDEEQHIQSLEPDGVYREEIHGDDALRLRAQELTP